jgi:hypothetical protein
MKAVSAADIENAGVRGYPLAIAEETPSLQSGANLVHQAVAVLGELERVIRLRVDPRELRNTVLQTSHLETLNSSGLVRYS